MQNLIGIKGGQNATFFEVLAVQESQIKKHPSIVNGKEQSFFDAPSTEHYMKHKKSVTFPGFVCTVTGNVCSSEFIISNTLGKGWRALAVDPHIVEVWRDSDYQAELQKLLSKEDLQ